MTFSLRTAAVILAAGLFAADGGRRVQAAGDAAQDRPARVAMPGVDGPVGTAVPDVAATPWVAPAGHDRTTAEIMGAVRDAATVTIATPNGGDAVAGALDLTATTPNVTLLSHGPNAEPDTNAVVPDPSGDVGLSQYLLAVNGRIRSYAKATGLADGVLDTPTDTFFQSVRDDAPTTNPRVRFDRKAGRWVVTMITAALPNRFLVAISNGATISGNLTTWRFFQWTNTRTQGGVGGGAACLGADPTLAFDDNAYYLGVNQRCGPGLANVVFDSTSLYVIRRSSLIGTTPTLVVSELDGLVATPTGPGIYAPQGALNYDSNPTFGYVVGVDNAAKGRLVVRRISNPGAQPLLTSDLVVTQEIDPTGDPINVPHLGGTLPLDGLDHRLSQAVIRDGRLWTSHHFAVNGFGEANAGGGRNGIRWYELTNLNTQPSLVQSGTVWDNAGVNPASYWMGTLTVNGQGHVTLGMSTAGSLSRVNAAVTGRLAGDPAEAMRAPIVYSDNTVNSYNLVGSPATVQPWGRTSSTSVDPRDDMTMWTMQPYVDGPSSYGLRLVRILSPAPPTITSLSPNTLANGVTGATVTVNATATSGAGFFDPGPGFTQRIAAAFSGVGVTVTDVAVVTPTRLRLTVDTTGALPGARTLTVTNPDGQAQQLASALTISANLNLSPIAQNDSGSTPFGRLLNIPAPGVLANDTDPEHQPLTAQLVATTTNGALTLNANGSLIYVPNAGFSGTDSFTYRAFDGVNQSNVATASIAVGVNAAPVFGATPGNVALFQAATPVSTGPLPFTVSDPDGNPLTVTATSSNTAVVPAAAVILGGSGASRTVTVTTIGATTLGSSTITLMASDGTLTATASFTVTVTASAVPGAPQNLTALVSRNTVLFTWQPPASASSEPVQTYVLEAGPGPSAANISLPLGNVLAFTATVPDAIYYVRVRAVTPAGPGPVSNEVVITLGQAAPPQPPQALLASVVGTLVRLQWTENPLGPVVAAYQVHAGTAPGLSDIGVIPLPPGSRSLTVDAPPNTYYVRLVAVNAAGASPPSNEAIITTGPGVCVVPAVPAGVQVSSGPGAISVRWDAAAAGAIPQNYVIEAGTVSGAANIGTFALPASATTIGGPVPAGPYFIRIRAANVCGASGPSAEVSATVQ
jgi:hypothetical protein